MSSPCSLLRSGRHCPHPWDPVFETHPSQPGRAGVWTPRAEVLTGAVDNVHGTPFSGETWAAVEMDRMVGRPMSLVSSEQPMKIAPVTLAGRKGKSLPSG